MVCLGGLWFWVCHEVQSHVSQVYTYIKVLLKLNIHFYLAGKLLLAVEVRLHGFSIELFESPHDMAAGLPQRVIWGTKVETSTTYVTHDHFGSMLLGTWISLIQCERKLHQDMNMRHWLLKTIVEAAYFNIPSKYITNKHFNDCATVRGHW